MELNQSITDHYVSAFHDHYKVGLRLPFFRISRFFSFSFLFLLSFLPLRRHRRSTLSLTTVRLKIPLQQSFAELERRLALVTAEVATLAESLKEAKALAAAAEASGPLFASLPAHPIILSRSMSRCFSSPLHFSILIHCTLPPFWSLV